MLLEICVDSVESALAAERGGAQRIELCGDLLEAGITPSAGMLQVVRSRVKIDIFVMIRPRGGDFFYTDSECEVMKADIQRVKELGADGIVLGILTTDGLVDVPRTRKLVQLAHPLPVTFHRAIDMAADFIGSLDRIAASGAQRVLTSGACRRVVDSTELLAKAVRKMEGQLTLMAGGGLSVEDLRKIVEETGITEFHSGTSARIPSPVEYRSESLFLGVDAEREYARYLVCQDDVQALREGLDILEREQATTARA